MRRGTAVDRSPRWRPRPRNSVRQARHRRVAATDLLPGIVATDTREQSGIWSTASGVLAAYRTDGAMASTNAPPLDSRRILCGAEHPLHLLDGTSTTPIRATRRRPRRRRARCRLRPCSQRRHDGPPTLLALDEVANIAPIPDLPAMVSEGGGQGLLVLACLQDLSQARAGGARRPTASSRSSAPRSCCRASPTPPRCATSARWRATTRWPRRRSAARSDRGARIRPSTSVGLAPRGPPARRRRGPRRAWPRARARAPTRTSTEVALTPAHTHAALARAASPPSADASGARSRDRLGR